MYITLFLMLMECYYKINKKGEKFFFTGFPKLGSLFCYVLNLTTKSKK